MPESWGLIGFMAETELYLRLAVALAIGLGVGLERGWHLRDVPSGRRETGFRTFAILSLTGFAVGVGLEPFGQLFAAVVALGVLSLIAAGYAMRILDKDSDRGATTEVAAFLTFVLGALAGGGALLAAGLTAVILVALLDYKAELHGFLNRVEKLELTAAVKLALVSVVLLPVLPDHGFGPGEVLNPHELWWAVVVIAALGLGGYAAMKVGGPQRGALFMGLMGGFVSSTAVTLNASRASKVNESAAIPLASAVATAQAVMFIRTGLLISVLNFGLLDHALIPLTLGALTAIVGALLITRRAETDGGGAALQPGSPDTLGAAIQFVAVVAVVLVLAHYAQMQAGDAGVIASGLLSGALDVDTATVTASRLAGDQLRAASGAAAALSIALALIANSFVKGGIAYALGSPKLAWRAIGVLAASAAAVAVGVVVQMSLPA